MSVLVTWSSLHIPAIFATLSTLWPYEREYAGLVVIVVWYSDDYSDPLLSWWESASSLVSAHLPWLSTCVNKTFAWQTSQTRLMQQVFFRPLQCWQPFLKYMVALFEGVGQPSCHSAEYQGRRAQPDQSQGPAVTQIVRYGFSAGTRDTYLEELSHTCAQGESHSISQSGSDN